MVFLGPVLRWYFRRADQGSLCGAGYGLLPSGVSVAVAVARGIAFILFFLDTGERTIEKKPQPTALVSAIPEI